MFRWFTRFFGSSRKTAKATWWRRSRLWVEDLEMRYCPSAPEISLEVTPGSDHSVLLHGHITDKNPAAAHITFSGAVTGSATVNAAGDYSVKLNAHAVGAVFASAVDDSGLVAASTRAWVPSSVVAKGPSARLVLAGTALAQPAFARSQESDSSDNGDGNGDDNGDGNGDDNGDGGDDGGDNGDDGGDNGAQAPSVTIEISPGSGRWVIISGQVTADDPSSCTVHLDGVVQADISVDADGNYSAELQADELGTVHATVEDSSGQVSDPVDADITCDGPSAPTITITHGEGRWVTVSGHVADDSPSSYTLHLAGAVEQDAGVDGDGNYSVEVQADNLGTVQATMENAWGQLSDEADADITCAAPSMNMAITPGSGRWVTISGHVTADDPSSCTVHVDGVVQTDVSVNGDGNYSVRVQADDLGTIHATVEDAWGQLSDQVDAEVRSNAPVIQQFTAVHVGPNQWTFSGRVIDECAPGLEVQLGGLHCLDGVTATVGQNGWFSVTVQRQSSDSGTATAQTSDWWGLDSNVAHFSVS